MGRGLKTKKILREIFFFISLRMGRKMLDTDFDFQIKNSTKTRQKPVKNDGF